MRKRSPISSRTRAAGLVVGLTLLASGTVASAATPATPPSPTLAAPGEAILEGRLLAPCCWTQTLDVHESELATSLRGEIRARISAGETAGAVEEDLVDRYTDRIRAVPKGGDVRLAIPIVGGLAILGGALGLVLLLARWTRRAKSESLTESETETESSGGPLRRDGYDDDIDAALQDLE